MSTGPLLPGQFNPTVQQSFTAASTSGALVGNLNKKALTSLPDQDDQHQDGETSHLSAAALQLQKEASGANAEQHLKNAQNSGAFSDIDDQMTQDGGEQNEVNERRRQAELEKGKDGRGLEAGVQTGRTVVGGQTLDLQEVSEQVEALDSRPPEDILSERGKDPIPAHAAAFATGTVNNQPADKLADIKPLPETRLADMEPELQPVPTLPVEVEPHELPVNGSAKNPGGAVPIETPPEVQAHMESQVAEQAMQAQNAGAGGEMLLADGSSAGVNGAGWAPGSHLVSGTDTQPKSDPAAASRAAVQTAREQLAASNPTYGECLKQIDAQAGGDEAKATTITRDSCLSLLTQGPEGQAIWSTCQADAAKTQGDPHMLFCERGRSYLDSLGLPPDHQQGKEAYAALNLMEASQKHLKTLGADAPAPQPQPEAQAPTGSAAAVGGVGTALTVDQAYSRWDNSITEGVTSKDEEAQKASKKVLQQAIEATEAEAAEYAQQQQPYDRDYGMALWMRKAIEAHPVGGDYNAQDTPTGKALAGMYNASGDYLSARLAEIQRQRNAQTGDNQD
ncbi:MAG: hypothetical protein AB1758_23660 [Candidatus Eremiobacterota bacterium]